MSRLAAKLTKTLHSKSWDYAVAYGINLFDTAEAYGGGESERIIGRWLRQRNCREQTVLQTKVRPNFTRDHIQESLERSLTRLGVDYIFYRGGSGGTSFSNAYTGNNAADFLLGYASSVNKTARPLIRTRRCVRRSFRSR